MSSKHGFDQFALANAQKLGRVAWLLTGHSHAAEDLVQDTLTNLYVHWSRVSSTDDPVRYARATMLNTFISGRRKRSSTERPVAAIVESTCECDYEVRTDLIRALATLNALDRTILVLRFFEDMSPPDVGGQLGMTAGAVRTRTSRALARVRPLLSDDYAPHDHAATQPTQRSPR